jgi:hypothetical protein
VSTWTVTPIGRERGLVVYEVLAPEYAGPLVALISVPDTDEGRATVALMVAAMEMREALTEMVTAASLDVQARPAPWAFSTKRLEDADRQARAALEASKKLPKEK